MTLNKNPRTSTLAPLFYSVIHDCFYSVTVPVRCARLRLRRRESREARALRADTKNQYDARSSRLPFTILVRDSRLTL